MTTYLFAWNPRKWPWENLSRALAQFAETGYTSEWWSCQSHKSIRVGDRAFLVRLGVKPKGIMASGRVLTESFLTPHWSGEGKPVKRVDIEFDTLIDPVSEKLLSLEKMTTPPFDKQNWTPQGSGIPIAPEVANELERVWFEHVETLGVVLNNMPEGDSLGSFSEGRKKRVHVNRYERSPHARRLCIERYGTKCVVCGINFGTVYGDLGEGFIHVHHLSPLSLTRETQLVDPIRDLRPVCPNCHAMLHKESPPITIEKLRGVLKGRA